MSSIFLRMYVPRHVALCTFGLLYNGGLTESISECIHQGPCGLYALCASAHPSCCVGKVTHHIQVRWFFEAEIMVNVTSPLRAGHLMLTPPLPPPVPSRAGVLSRGVC